MHMGDRTWTPPPEMPEREPRVDEFTVDENPEGSLDDYYGWPTVAEVE